MKINLTFCILIILVCGCKEKGGHEFSTETNIKEAENLAFQESLIVGKSINLDGIFGDTLSTSSRAILMYTGYDCQSCIDSGFKIVNYIDSLKKSEYFLIAEIQSNKGKDQLRYDYSNYIYTDKDDLIRKQLKYLKTPVILFLDTANIIRKVHFPETNERVDQEAIAKLLKN
ncbi:MAG TPA: hypothetical protein PK185_07825 [Cyclobacteriaceae bacterium]|nr:hypothetical protein [Cyclobacteriaceae bacterium]